MGYDHYRVEVQMWSKSTPTLVGLDVWTWSWHAAGTNKPHHTHASRSMTVLTSCAQARLKCGCPSPAKVCSHVYAALVAYPKYRRSAALLLMVDKVNKEVEEK
eukprot:4112264-Amphidinium_carterae.1